MRKPHVAPIDWARVETIMVRVLGTGKARIADMNALTRAFRADPKRYDEAHVRANAKVMGRSPVS